MIYNLQDYERSLISCSVKYLDSNIVLMSEVVSEGVNYEKS